MFPIDLKGERVPPDTPDQRAKDAKKAEIKAALKAGNRELAMQLTNELMELRTAFYRSQQSGGGD